ncbi:hypothetical protein COO60DRAFT_562149 [Scenedesmus sp. NREL 46B-D3]|nr:hypothetical protein COO60DRAFT_562149 [Scenedesmus sp. NREL 46B-D3]
MPSGVSPMCKGAGKADAAASFVYTAGAQWRSKPPAMERLRRYRNTLELKMLVADLRDRVPITISDIRHYATARGGFHTHCMERTTGPGGHSDVRTLMDVLLGSPGGKDFNKDELKHNLMGDCPGAEMAAGCGLPGAHRPPRRPADSPLHMVGAAGQASCTAADQPVSTSIHSFSSKPRLAVLAVVVPRAPELCNPYAHCCLHFQTAAIFALCVVHCCHTMHALVSCFT